TRRSSDLDDRREREYSGNSVASTASKRRPASVSGTVAWRGSAGARGAGLVESMLLLSPLSPPAPPRPVPMTLRPAFLRLSGLLLVILLAVPGCATVKGIFGGDDESDENVPVAALYERGHASMTGGNWSRAEKHFGRLMAQYPYGEYTEQALMETAYAQYKSGKHESAISTIDRFLRTYPTHRNVPYMYYLRGLVNSGRDTVFLQRVWRL